MQAHVSAYVHGWHNNHTTKSCQTSMHDLCLSCVFVFVIYGDLDCDRDRDRDCDCDCDRDRDRGVCKHMAVPCAMIGKPSHEKLLITCHIRHNCHAHTCVSIHTYMHTRTHTHIQKTAPRPVPPYSCTHTRTHTTHSKTKFRTMPFPAVATAVCFSCGDATVVAVLRSCP